MTLEYDTRRKSQFMNQNTIEVARANAGLLAPVVDWSDMGEVGHFVQFYERDEFLVESVSGFIGAALRIGDAAIVIATESHRQALDERLKKQGFDVNGCRATGRYVPLDAAQTLAQFMVNGAPDSRLFRETIGSVMARASKGGRRVRAFGEMVALLWAEGKGDAAIQLEELWNDLARTYSFSLFCAYPMEAFRGVSNGKPFVHICQAHSRVIPAESYAAQGDVDERLRSISLLQQKASSLEAETEERKHAEAARHAEQTRLNMAVAVAGLGIWEIDLVTNSLICSDQCKTHFGVEPHEPLSYERFLGLVHPDDRAEVQEVLRAAMDGNKDYEAEYRIIDPHGSLRWIASRGRCFHNGSHRMLGVALDITERKQAAEILEQTVMERTAELHETIAELEAFSFSISHDMRAPLRSMRGFADVLLRECGDKLPPEYRSYLERIAASGERMDRMIQDVLTFSRVARTELNLEPINLEHLVRGILECYPNLQMPQAEVVIEGHLPAVIGHAAALTQCLSNLLGNAVKFVALGTQPSVRVWAEFCPPAGGAAARAPRKSPGRTVRVYVQDNGIGIPKEAQAKIFTIFQRLNKNYEGTGIGLAIVKKAAERMGGKVGLTSAPGQGSTFWLELKAADASGA